MKQEKRLYAQKLTLHLTCVKEPCGLWQGFKNISDYKPLPPKILNSNCSLPDELIHLKAAEKPMDHKTKQDSVGCTQNCWCSYCEAPHGRSGLHHKRPCPLLSSHGLFSLLPSGRKLWSIRPGLTRARLI